MYSFFGQLNRISASFANYAQALSSYFHTKSTNSACSFDYHSEKEKKEREKKREMAGKKSRIISISN